MTFQTPLAWGTGWDNLSGFFAFSLLWLSFFLEGFIFCRHIMLGFVHRWIRKTVSQPLFPEVLDLGSRKLQEEKRHWQCYNLRSAAKVTSLHCKDFVYCGAVVLKYVLLKRNLLEYWRWHMFFKHCAYINNLNFFFKSASYVHFTCLKLWNCQCFFVI